MPLEESLKIAFTGPSGTGKTTLARWVSKQIGLELNPVGSRSVSKKLGVDNPYDVDKIDLYTYNVRLNLHAGDPTIETRRDAAERGRIIFDVYSKDRRSMPTLRPLFQQQLQMSKMLWEKGRSGFVTDRTPIDDMAYALQHCPEVVDDTFMRIAYEHTASYDLVFFCSEVDFYHHGNDPARVDDRTYHKQFEVILRGGLTHCVWGSSKLVQLRSNDLQLRQWMVRGAIEDAYYSKGLGDPPSFDME